MLCVFHLLTTLDPILSQIIPRFKDLLQMSFVNLFVMLPKLGLPKQDEISVVNEILGEDDKAFLLPPLGNQKTSTAMSKLMFARMLKLDPTETSSEIPAIQ